MADVFNWLLAVDLGVAVIVAIAFLFYLNRLGAYIVFVVLRFFIWRSSNVWLSVGSIQLALLAGRISFRDVQYHSSNSSFRVLHGNITWRYWKFRTRQEVDTTGDDPRRSECKLHAG